MKAQDTTSKSIYLAGGCFWGVEKYFSQIPGVIDVNVGYANGNTDNPTYKQVCSGSTGDAEAIHVTYDPKIIGLKHLLELYFKIIDPISLNQQGNDKGTQYRTGIYYVDPADIKIAKEALAELQKSYDKPLVIELEPLKKYTLAENYHQDYLDNNPHGYCHLSKALFSDAAKVKPRPDQDIYPIPTQTELKKQLSPLEYKVTQEGATERPYENAYWNEKGQGIYVDVTTGEPLFSSNDKFDACGWPSFSKPITSNLVSENLDTSNNMTRQEVVSSHSKAHLGHVFDDGPKDKGGLRYCINSASLKFIPINKMKEAGYGDYLYLFQPKTEKNDKSASPETQNTTP